MIEVIIENRRYSVTLRLHSKFNLLLGATSTGKSYLTKMLPRFSQDSSGKIVASNGIHVYTNRVERPELLQQALRSERGAVFVFDEDSAFVSTDEYLRELLDSPNYFIIIIGRDNFSRLPYGVNSVFELQGDKRHRVQMLQAYTSELKNQAINCSSDSSIVCEGSGLDYVVIRKKYGAVVKQVVPAGGKDKIVATLNQISGKKILLCDWCGTGGATARLIFSLSSSQVLSVISPSFEYELLGNRWLCGVDGAQLRQHYSERLLDFKSEEVFYEECVDYCLHHYFRIAYSKAGDGPLATLVCRGKVLYGKTLKEGEPQPVKLNWLYPKLKTTPSNASSSNTLGMEVKQVRLE